MTVIYRQAQAESKDFEPDSFGTMHAANAEFLAEVEAGSGSLPPDPRLYQVDVIMGDEDLSERPLEDFLPFVEGRPKWEALPQLRDFLLKEAKRNGCPWMQLTAPHDPNLHAAMVYVGEGPIRTQLAPAE
jgi:hypothetical protein